MKTVAKIMLALGASTLMGMQAARAECIQVRFENNSNRTVRYLYVSPSTFVNWLDDVLGAYSLYPGDSDLFSACFRSTDDNYDFKAIFDDGTSSEWRDGVRIIRAGSVWIDSAMVLHSSR